MVYAILIIVGLIVGLLIRRKMDKSAKESYQEDLVNLNQEKKSREEEIRKLDELARYLTDTFEEKRKAIENDLEEFKLNKLQEKTEKEQELQEWLEIQTEKYQSNIQNQKLTIEKDLAVLRETGKLVAASEISKELDARRREFDEAIAMLQEKISRTSESLSDLRASRQAAIEMYKREKEQVDNVLFYRMHLTADNEEDIQYLQSVEKFLHNREVLNKLIYKTYYEKPYTDLAGRVIGIVDCGGIYKITRISDNMVYIGQATSFKDRWKSHIKRALGAEPMTQNKLYPAMAESGPQNFTFEILEKCTRDKFNEKEKFWIEYYQSNSYGFNIKAGG